MVSVCSADQPEQAYSAEVLAIQHFGALQFVIFLHHLLFVACCYTAFVDCSYPTEPHFHGLAAMHFFDAADQLDRDVLLLLFGGADLGQPRLEALGQPSQVAQLYGFELDGSAGQPTEVLFEQKFAEMGGRLPVIGDG